MSAGGESPQIPTGVVGLVSTPSSGASQAVVEIPDRPVPSFRLGINLVRFGDPHIGGNLVYAKELVRRFADRGMDLRLFCYDTEQCVELFGEDLRRFCVEVPGKRAMLAMHFGLRKACQAEHVDVFFSPSHLLPLLVPRCPTVCTIHDLNFKHFSQGKRKDFYKSVMYRYLVNHATRIITVSDFTKRDVIDSFPRAEGKIIRIHNGVTKTEAGEGASTEPPYLMAIGHHPHKHPEFTIHVLARVLELEPDSNLRLKICGLPPARQEQLRAVADESGISDAVDLLPFIPDAELARLYEGAVALLFPSKFEGFGMPVLEAMAHGTPVIALNTTSLPEVMGDAGVLMPDKDVYAWANEVVDLFVDKVRWQQLWQRGQIQAALFSWDKCADRLIEVFTELARKPR